MAGDIFRAYDIRGIYGVDLTDQIAYNVGKAFVSFLKCKRVVVGRDMRPHSKPLFDFLSKGITEMGADVIDLGMCSTPMSYYANGTLEADAGIMITASHNPGEWNGFKLSREKAVPISGDTGIMTIAQLAASGAFGEPVGPPGTVGTYDIASAYGRHVNSFALEDGPLRIAVDYANSMGVYEAQALKDLFVLDPIFEELDGSFPNHEANPLKTETLVPLQQKVREGGHDFGIAFDGDADRVGFIDERGEVVPNDMTAALIAQAILSRNKGGRVLYDLRSSWAVKEVVEENGGRPSMCRVGHAFIKKQMRDEDAVFAAELSGHYYFRENFYTESSALAAIYVADLVRSSGKKLSELIKPLKRYHASGEINSVVQDTTAVYKRLMDTYPDGRMETLDGLSIEYEDWWFNVRPSNTEPLVRLNLEARTEGLMAYKLDEVLSIIRG